MKKLFFTLFIILSVNSSAQFRFEKFGVEHGLSQSNARAFVQDKEGFLWVGTWDGLNRYDGYSFTSFQFEPTEKNSIAGSNILHLQVDILDRIWIVFVDGRINVYDKKKNQFHLLTAEENQPLTVASTTSIVEDDDGSFIALKNGELIKINYMTFEVSKFKPSKPISAAPANEKIKMALANSSTLFIRTASDEIYKIDAEFGIASLKIISEEKILVGSVNGELFEFEFRTKSFKLIKKFMIAAGASVGVIHAILNDSQNRIWIATASGLFLSEDLDHKNYSFINLESEEENAQQSFAGFSIYEDYSGVIWIGTYYGIYKLNPQRKNFQSFPPKNNFKKVFGSDGIFGINHFRDSLVLIGTTGGFYEFDPDKNSYKKFTAKNSSLSNATVYFIFIDSKERIWLGTRYGLNLYNHISKKFIPYFFNDVKISSEYLNKLYAIAEDAEGKLWLGSSQGLIRFNPSSKEYEVFSYDTEFGIEGDTFVLSLLLDKNILWVGTNSEGLLKINLKDMSFKRFIGEAGKTNSLSNNKVSVIHKDKANRIWVATFGGGVNLLSEDEKTFRHFTMKDGLPNNIINGALEDEENNIWFSTNNGLSKINSQNFSIQNYSATHGVAAIEFNLGSFAKNRKGYFFFGGVEGISYFIPSEIKINNVKPKIAITDFKLFNKSRKDLLAKDEIILNYNENFFGFEIAALIFENPSENKYAYKLEGLNEDWVFIDKRRSLDFSYIEPGEYILKVKATNEDNIWSDEVVIAKIKIIPPFWKTAWFIALTIFISIFIIVMIVRSYIRKKYQERIAALEKEKLILEERTKTRDKIARDLHDDLASTVSSAGLFLHSAKQLIKKDVETAQQYLEKSSSILNEAEQSMSDIVWSVSPSYDTLHNLSLRIKILAGELCEANEINLHFESSGEMELPISEDIRRNLYLAVKEVLANAVKHSKAKELKIAVEIVNGKIAFEISDNGKGFSFESKEEKLGGNGLKNIRKRCNEIGAEVEIFSKINEGTKVRIEYNLQSE